MTSPPVKRGPGRPRSTDSDEFIALGIWDLLEAGQPLSVEAVAKRAGVGKPTIYRRLRDDGLPDLIALALPRAQADLLPAKAKRPREVTAR